MKDVRAAWMRVQTWQLTFKWPNQSGESLAQPWLNQSGPTRGARDVTLTGSTQTTRFYSRNWTRPDVSRSLSRELVPSSVTDEETATTNTVCA